MLTPQLVHECSQSIAHNSQKVETTQMPISRGTAKHTVVCAYNGIPSGHRKEGNIILWDRMDGPGEQYVSEISQPEKGK